MKTARKFVIVLAVLSLWIAGANADDGESRQGRGRHHGPPPEAFTACEGKAAGDTAQFTGRRGETVTGTCEQEGERLVLRPDFMKNRSKGGPNGHREE